MKCNLVIVGPADVNVQWLNASRWDRSGSHVHEAGKVIRYLLPGICLVINFTKNFPGIDYPSTSGVVDLEFVLHGFHHGHRPHCCHGGMRGNWKVVYTHPAQQACI